MRVVLKISIIIILVKIITSLSKCFHHKTIPDKVIPKSAPGSPTKPVPPLRSPHTHLVSIIYYWLLSYLQWKLHFAIPYNCFHISMCSISCVAMLCSIGQLSISLWFVCIGFATSCRFICGPWHCSLTDFHRSVLDQ